MEQGPKSTASLESMLGARPGDDPTVLIQRYLAEVRRQLRMDVAYVAELRDGQRVFRFVEGDALPESIRVGASDPAEETYAQRVADGRLDAVVRMAQQDVRLKDLRETREWGIGSFVGAPLRLPDGRLYGALCTFSRAPNSLEEYSARFLNSFAQLISAQLEHIEGEGDDLRRQIERIEHVLHTGSVAMVFQPIMDIRRREMVGVEALARFPVEPQRPPNVWFDEAWTVGRGVDLELAAIAAALGHVGELPPDAFLAVNVSPETISSPRMEAALIGLSVPRLILEFPERAPINDHYALTQSVARLRGNGVRLAVDDAGAGFENLSNILELAPDIIKFDVALTRDVDTDPVRHSLASSLVSFAGQIESVVVAEGIETEAELNALRDIGFGFGQGFHLGRPGPLPSAGDRAPAP
ncbi:MAG TPA: EAL domain-containing protein [Actinomycetota bacterium]|nr:EAL domain-containing protein [Actinomycetota bacterium]